MDKLTRQSQIDIGTAALAGVYMDQWIKDYITPWVDLCCKDHLNCMVPCRLEG